MSNQKYVSELLDFIKLSPTSFHTVQNVGETLKKYGFIQLDMKKKWTIEKGGKYFITKNASSLIAFKIGKGIIEKDGFKLIGAHTDSPTFRIKPNPEIVESTYLKLNTEVYGGPILTTWFDRPLSIAGRISLKRSYSFLPETRLINISKPVLVIPNLAIHLTRDISEGIKIDKQKDVLPVLSMVNESFEKDNYLSRLLAEQLNIKNNEILDFELYLYEAEKGKIIGLNNEFVSASRLDDLGMVHAGLKALINPETNRARGTNMLVLFDNEEIGSRTKQGADSPLLRNIMERITLALGKNREHYLQSLENSIIISADMAHALHPNFTDRYDPTNRPVINGGPVIKISANRHYTSDSKTGGLFENICNMSEIPYQNFVNRSDQKGGSTIGPINTTQLGINSLDVGNPILAMHSIRELAGVKDHHYIIKAFKEFFSY